MVLEQLAEERPKQEPSTGRSENPERPLGFELGGDAQNAESSIAEGGPETGVGPLGVPLLRKERGPEVGEKWAKASKWRVALQGRWKRKEHNNILEGRAGLMCVRRSARSSRNFLSRMLILTDSQVCQGAFSKGRSSSFPLLLLSRRLASLQLGLRIKVGWRYINTALNPSDGPSRGLRWPGVYTKKTMLK